MLNLDMSNAITVQKLFDTEEFSDVSKLKSFTSPFSYTVLSLSNGDFSLILVRTKTNQVIVECSESGEIRELCSFSRYSIVISASLSKNREKLLVVLFSSSNTFMECNHYIVKCILVSESPQITYPVTNILEEKPVIEWTSHPDRFLLFTQSDKYEIWELTCSKTEFNLHKVNKSESGILWCSVTNKETIEYIKPKGDMLLLYSMQEDNTTTRINIPTDSEIVNNLPKTDDFRQMRTITFYNHLKTDNGQNVLLIYSNSVLSLVLLKAGVFLNINYSHKGNYEFFNIAAMRNDLILIDLHEMGYLCVLIDALSQPRAVFCLKQSVKMSLSFLSSNSYHALDTKTGKCSKFTFNYGEILKDNPHIFLPLLHDSIMSEGFDTEIFLYLTNDILSTFWNGVVFDEFLLCLVRCHMRKTLTKEQIELFSDKVTTFCPATQYTEELGLFNPFQSQFMDRTKLPPPMQNWGRLATFFPSIVDSLSKQLISLIISLRPKLPEATKRPALIQILTLILRVTNDSLCFEDFIEEVFPEFPPIVKETWCMREIVGFDDMKEQDEANDEMNWWIQRTPFIEKEDFNRKGSFENSMRVLERMGYVFEI